MSMTSRPPQAQTESSPGFRRGVQAALSRVRKPRMNPRRVLPVGAALVVVAIAAGAAMQWLMPGPETVLRNHAIWLDRAWTFGNADSSQLDTAVADMRQNGIGKVYAYASTLGVDGRWDSGIPGDSFLNTREKLAAFLQSMRQLDEAMAVYAWLEIWTYDQSADGYRLDDENLRQNIADFSQMLVGQLGFDGLMLDIKPMFSDNGDVISLIRRVRSAIGLEKPIGIAVTADLTPHNLRAQNITVIAPGTMWSDNFKRRVMVSADEIALSLFASYRQQPSDFVDWVAYHVETYINLLEIETEVYASVPHFSWSSPAHNPDVETMASALDGVSQGLRRLGEEKRGLLTGVAIFADRRLSDADWSDFRANWQNR